MAPSCGGLLICNPSHSAAEGWVCSTPEVCGYEPEPEQSAALLFHSMPLHKYTFTLTDDFVISSREMKFSL